MSLGEFRENLFDIVGGEAANTRLLGLHSGSLDSIQKSGSALARSFDEARQLEEERSRKSVSEIAFLTLLDQLNGQIEWLQGKIDEAEKGFEERYGEDWREQMAQRILNPDEIPERREGESMEDYRERLEQALIDKMLDENGNIKPEYMNDPELREWAEWAQWMFDQRAARQLKTDTSAPGLSEADIASRVDKYKQTASYDRTVEAQSEFGETSAQNIQLRDAADQERDKHLNSVDTNADDIAFKIS